MLSWSGDGRTLTTPGQRWSSSHGTRLASLPLGWKTAYSRDGPRVAIVDRDDIQIQDDTGRVLHRIWPSGESAEQGAAMLAFSPNGGLLAISHVREQLRNQPGLPPEPSVQLWDVATGKLVRGLRPDSQAPDNLLFSPDGRQLATSTWRGKPQLFEVETGWELCQLSVDEPGNHWDAVNPLAFTRDGSLLATGGKEGVILLWETASGRLVLELRGHEGFTRSLAFSPDDRYLLSGGADTTALIWPVVPAGGEAVKPAAWDKDTPARLWAALAGDPATEAYPAMWALLAAPERALELLQERLRPDPPLDRRVKQLIADLGHDQFAPREQASRELERLGASVKLALLWALRNKLELEHQRRIERVLSRLNKGGAPDASLLRGLRAILTLERLQRGDAEAVLRKMAKGGEGGPLTQAAEAALARLEVRRQRGRVAP
jgi:hypothetical protein